MTDERVDNGPPIDEALAVRLVRAQFPQWSSLEVRALGDGGWDNRTFRLGTDMLIRMPSAAAYSPQVAKEHRWLPMLSRSLTLPIPEPLALGEPGEGYQWPWSVYRWIPGRTVAAAGVRDRAEFAGDVARFLQELSRIDTAGGPVPGVHNFWRGGAVERYGEETGDSIAALGEDAPKHRLLAIWDDAIAASWDGAAVWIHGDLATTNLSRR